jgi:hypothetical protein
MRSQSGCRGCIVASVFVSVCCGSDNGGPEEEGMGRNGKNGAVATDRAQLAELEAATREIKTLMVSVVDNFYGLGVVLGRVVSKELFRAKGYETFDAYLDGEVGLSERQAKKLIRISQRFTRRAAKELGFERLEAAASLMDATPAEEDPAKVDEIPIRTGKKTAAGRVETKPLGEATAEEIEAAARAEKAKRRSRATAGPDRRARPVAGDRFALAAEKKLRDAGLDHVDVKARKAAKDAKVDDGQGFVIDLLGLGPELATKALASMTRRG